MSDFWLFWIVATVLLWLIALAEHVSELFRRKRQARVFAAQAKRLHLHRDQAKWRVEEVLYPTSSPMPSVPPALQRRPGAVRRPLYYVIRSLDAPRLEMGLTFDLAKTVQGSAAHDLLEVLTFTTHKGLSEWLEQRLAEVGGDIEKLQDQPRLAS